MNPTCTHQGCSAPAVTRDLCRKHYDHLKNAGLLTLLPKLTMEERFWAKVDKNGPLPDLLPELGHCWIWTGGVEGDGYGQFYIDHARPAARSHIVAWTWVNGPVPDGLVLDHKCLRRHCVRTSHLRTATRSMNSSHFAGAKAHSTTGIRGVHKIGKRYYARATFNGIEYRHKGGFATPEEAGRAAAELRRKYHPGNILD